MQTLNAHDLNVVVVLDPADVLKLQVPDGAPRTEVFVKAPQRAFPADLAASSVHRTIAAVREHGPDGCVVMIRGRYDGGDRLMDCDIFAQPKAQKAEPADYAV
jgi:hypothetical protein